MVRFVKCTHITGSTTQKGGTVLKPVEEGTPTWGSTILAVVLCLGILAVATAAFALS